MDKPQDAKALARKYKRATDKKDKDQIYNDLVQLCEPSIRSLLNRYHVIGYDQYDLRQICLMSILKTIDNYDPKRGEFLGLFYVIARRNICNEINYEQAVTRKPKGQNEILFDNSSWETPTNPIDNEDQSNHMLRNLLPNLSQLEQRTLVAVAHTIKHTGDSACVGNFAYPDIIALMGKKGVDVTYKQIDNILSRIRRKAKRMKANEKDKVPNGRIDS